ncbi:MAG: sigma-54-dependent Fis family transcriptional regulator [Pirellulales bacterium]
MNRNNLNSTASDRTADLLSDIVAWSVQLSDPGEVLTAFLAAARESFGVELAALAIAKDGRWSARWSAGAERRLPESLLADALDKETLVVAEHWLAAPLAPLDRGEVVLVGTTRSGELLRMIVPALASAVAAVRQRSAAARRLRRLETILEIAQQWYRTNETEALLVQMARAATQLLHADRASIFLWDRANRLLVGRPALGIEDGELRIPDDTGIVGDVVRTGRPRRLSADSPQPKLAPEVTRRLAYKTKTLLCVPLVTSDGRMLGAFEVLNKRSGDFTDEDEQGLVELASHAAIALENTRQFEQLLAAHRQIVDQAADQVRMVGQSPAIEALRSTVARVADTELAILILGENGTGKEVVSRSVHYLSRRRDQPFIAVNCAAITETLLESELFGHEKGAFTDAHQSRPGKFELASGGTLFLDEIGDLSPGGQAKLLRVLEEKVVVRVGGSTPIHTDARVLAATNQNLAEMVRRKDFREDLYFRLNVVTLELPPLRERGEDVLLLAGHFLDDFCEHARRKVPKFTAAARKRLLRHTWPGNVRELRNLMERLAYLVPGDTIDADDLAFIISPPRAGADSIDADLPLADATQQFQVRYINQAIDRMRGHMGEAAEQLGLHRSNLYRKMRSLDMPTRKDAGDSR